MVLAAAVIVAVASLFCVMIASDNSSADDAHKIGDNVYWTDDGSGNITITGTGDMYAAGTSGADYWGESIKTATIENGVTSVGAKAFEHCSSLTSVVIPDSVTKIEERAFYNCTKLADLKMSNNVERIEKNAFALCYDLSSVTLPGSLTYIGDSAFAKCALISLSIPASVTYIGSDAFNCCYDLVSVYFSQNVAYVHDYAFYMLEFYQEDGTTKITDLKTLNGLYHEFSSNKFQQASSHSWVVTAVGKAPTCTESGLTSEADCSVCHLHQAQEVIPARGHTYGTEIAQKDATSTANGVKAHYECSECHLLFVKNGSEYTQVSESDLVIPAKGGNGDGNGNITLYVCLILIILILVIIAIWYYRHHYKNE